MALSKGDNGDEVTTLQNSLIQLGFALDADGDFGTKTHNAVITLQTIFGYDADGVVGPGTHQLIDSQVGYHWNLQVAQKAFKTDAPAQS